jgi:ATP-dependent DNA helicase DinG
MDSDLRLVFDSGGLLSQHVDGYAPRQQQLEMAQRIAETLAERSILIAEAGTGTGKTFAYLAPSILSGQKVFISTGTKNLQDQLFSKDLPRLKKALGQPFKAALLKGRSNYLCHHRLELAEADPNNKSQYEVLHDLRNWSAKTRTGDLSEADLLDEQSPLWPKVTSTVDNCLGQNCPDYDACFIVEARRNAQEADIVVVNHHLLMSDLALKASGQGEVLPEADAYIIDEAHQLPSIAGQFLGQRVSSHQIQELCRDSIREMEQEASDMQSLRDRADKTEATLHLLKLALGESESRQPWANKASQVQVSDKLGDLIEQLERLHTELEAAAERGKGLSQCHERAQLLIDKLSLFSENSTDDNLILWLETHQGSFVLNATPHQISEHFQSWLDDKKAAWIFTSATLTVAGKFNNFSQQLGIQDAATAVWESPFDYSRQSLLLMPTIPVEPNDINYNGYITDIAREVIELSKGRTFLLFTSYKALNEVAEALKDCDYPLMIQGTASKASLLESFREHGNAVLLGTNSFWEGVDVRGEALSCVLIDKIPFASPGDPLLEARINLLREQGGNPFRSIQIPAAVIQLKQGIGRLIRDENDRGVLVLCDPRFLSKPYGKVFLRSLPPMPITQQINDVANFFD